MSLVQTPQEIPLLDILRRSGAVTFERYMALCLYHPEYGYYMRGHERTGARGDYFTSRLSDDVHVRRLVAQLERLGQHVTLSPADPEAA